jgi:copper chaperone CopZ
MARPSVDVAVESQLAKVSEPLKGGEAVDGVERCFGVDIKVEERVGEEAEEVRSRLREVDGDAERMGVRRSIIGGDLDVVGGVAGVHVEFAAIRVKQNEETRRWKREKTHKTLNVGLLTMS